jgi:hypothetical protein
MNDSKLTFKKWPSSVASPGATFEKTLKTSSSPQFVGWRQQQQIQVRTCSPTMAQYCAAAVRMVQHKADLAVCGGVRRQRQPWAHCRLDHGRQGGGGRGGRVTKVQLPSFRVKASVFRHSATLAEL